MTSSIPITQTKISIPRRRTELLSRKRLLDLLNGFMDTKLAIIAAPAGYGKTSLLIDFAKQSHIPICWYSIDPLDQEITRFITHLISAINKRFPAFGKDSISAFIDKYDADINIAAICTTIVNDLFEHVLEHFIIILDDYHLLGSNPKVEQFIGQFIHTVDENCHLIIASRALLTLPDLPLLVAQSQVSGLSYEELVFSPEEVRALFLQNYQLDLSQDVIDNLMAQTEGWITGLALATQMYGQETTHLARIKRVTGVSLYDYLSEQVFLKQPDQIKTFLLFTSLLEEFDIQLCREILSGCMGKTDPDWSELVNYTMRNSLFALPVGDDMISIRYHHLFRDFLQSRVIEEFPQESRLIRSRLAIHYKDQQDWVHAYNIFKRLGDDSAIITMLVEDGSKIMSSGNLQSLTEWLNDIPEDVLLKHPELLSLMGPVRIIHGQVEAGLKCLDEAIPRLLVQGKEQQLIRAFLRRSDGCRLLGKYDLAIKDALQALSICGKSKKMIALHAEALRALGISHYQTGALLQSKKNLTKALSIYTTLNDTHNIALLSMEIGLVFTHMGEYELAKSHYLKALELWAEKGNSVWLANLNNNLGVLYHQLGDYETAISTLERAYANAKLGGYPRMEAYSLASIGDILRDLEAISEAEQAYQKALAINERIKDRFLTVYLGLAEAELALNTCNHEKAKMLGFQALDQARNDASALEIAPAEIWCGHYHISLNQNQAAINILISALEKLEREQDLTNSSLAHFYLAVAYYQSGSQKNATKQMALAVKNAEFQQEWSNLVARALPIKKTLSKIADSEAGKIGLGRLLSLMTKFEKSLPGLRRHLRQYTQIVSFGPPRLSIHGLGCMQVKLNNKTVTNSMWQTVLSRNLFFFLLLHPSGMTKETIGLSFWPDADPDEMKLRFKNAIYRLRRAIGKEVILYEDDRYSFNRSLDYEYDVDDFTNEIALAGISNHKPEQLVHYLNAIHLYKGVLLPELENSEIIVERERLQHLFENTCIKAADLALSMGDYQVAINLCLRAIEQEPYLEAAYRICFKAYAASGNKISTKKLFKQLEHLLHEDLSITPSTETIRVYKEST